MRSPDRYIQYYDPYMIALRDNLQWADLHNHTVFSDGSMQPGELVEAGIVAGMSAIAVTDHNVFGGAYAAVNYAIQHNLEKYIQVIPGVEISTEDGHVLAWRVEDAFPKYESVAKSIKRVHSAGGLVAAAHIGLPLASSLSHEAVDGILASDDPEVYLDAVEMFNGTGEELTRFDRGLIFRRSNARARRYFGLRAGHEKIGAAVGNGDNHGKRVGNGATVFLGGSVMESIKRRETAVMAPVHNTRRAIGEVAIFSAQALANEFRQHFQAQRGY